MQAEVARYGDGVGLRRLDDGHRRNVVLAVVVHHVVGRDEGRHVSARLVGEIGVDFPIVALPSGTSDGFAHHLRTAVVGGQNQCPIVKLIVEFFQILRGGGTGFERVAALIEEAVDGQVEALRGGRHKLPKTGGTDTTHRGGVECTFDDGEVFQFERKAFGFEGFFKDGDVEVLRAEHETHR